MPDRNGNKEYYDPLESYIDPMTGEIDTDRQADGEYKLGFHPHVRPHQFKKGVSGNPAGRPKGSKNKRTLRQEVLDEGGLTPAQFLASVVNDENANVNQRIRAAEAAAKFFDPALNSIEVHTDEDAHAPFNIILNAVQEDDTPKLDK